MRRDHEITVVSGEMKTANVWENKIVVVWEDIKVQLSYCVTLKIPV